MLLMLVSCRRGGGGELCEGGGLVAIVLEAESDMRHIERGALFTTVTELNCCNETVLPVPTARPL